MKKNKPLPDVWVTLDEAEKYFSLGELEEMVDAQKVGYQWVHGIMFVHSGDLNRMKQRVESWGHWE